jgi:hypothetical protein
MNEIAPPDRASLSAQPYTTGWRSGLGAEAAGVIGTLRRLASPAGSVLVCDLCASQVASVHRHLIDIATRRIICACPRCALRFEGVSGGRLRLIPREARALPNFCLTDAQWEEMALPIDLAFIFHNSASGKLTAVYPSPGGPLESLLPLATWHQVLKQNGGYGLIEPDVEAILVNRLGLSREYFIAPIDLCYTFVGLVRLHWRGLSGGESLWREIEVFFERLRAQTGSRFSAEGVDCEYSCHCLHGSLRPDSTRSNRRNSG